MDGWLNFRDHLYLGEGIQAAKLDKMKNKLQKSPVKCGFFVLAISRNPAGQIEFYKGRQLAWPYYRKNPPTIIGFAADYDESVGLVEQIVRDCLRERGDLSLKEYLL